MSLNDYFEQLPQICGLERTGFRHGYLIFLAHGSIFTAQANTVILGGSLSFLPFFVSFFKWSSDNYLTSLTSGVHVGLLFFIQLVICYYGSVTIIRSFQVYCIIFFLAIGSVRNTNFRAMFLAFSISQHFYSFAFAFSSVDSSHALLHHTLGFLPIRAFTNMRKYPAH